MAAMSAGTAGEEAAPGDPSQREADHDLAGGQRRWQAVDSRIPEGVRQTAVLDAVHARRHRLLDRRQPMGGGR
jgi:hypothetical protein